MPGRRFTRGELIDARARLQFKNQKQASVVASVLERLAERPSIGSGELNDEQIQILDDALEEIYRQA
ncbi:MAG TPA: hypothetical protein VEC17_03670 [Candidatus Binatia bacterium]|nr:hypothetical protein [Candidatus Binatia bacterium]